MKRLWISWNSLWLTASEVVEIERVKQEKVRCPYCGYPVNAMKSEDAKCKGIFFKCKNKECKKIFELKI
nr:MAG TPA: cysteine-rich protein [Caudoviricetes sp.]